MRVLSLLICAFILPATAAGGDSFNDQLTRTLSDNAIDIQMLGTLKYCDKIGLRDPVLKSISDSIVSHASGDTAVQLLQIADRQASGVEMGLNIAQLDPVEKMRVCDFAVRYVDQLMQKRIQESGP